MSTTKKRRGRPRKSSEETQNKGVLLLLNAKEKEGFQAAARVAGLPLSAWMRERLRRVAAAELVEAGMRIGFLPKNPG